MVFLPLSIRENISLTNFESISNKFGFISSTKENENVESLINRLSIKATDQHMPVKNLSGGNQQKVIIARWLATDPRFLILDEPTRGIDVGAKAEIQKLILGLSEDGLAILFISSELDEVITCCDRIVVLRDRKVLSELSGEAMEEANIMQVIASKDVIQ